MGYVRSVLAIAVGAALVACVQTNVVIGQVPGSADEELRREFRQHEQQVQDSHNWQELACVPRKRLVCSGASCSAATPVVHIRLTREGPTRGTMSRCDQGCDIYEVSISTAGIFTSIQPIAPRGALVKVMGAQEFIEVVTLGLDAHLASGECSRIR